MIGTRAPSPRPRHGFINQKRSARSNRDVNQARVYVVAPEPLATELSQWLSRLGARVHARLAQGDHVVAAAQRTPGDLVVIHSRLEGELTGLATARQLRATWDGPLLLLGTTEDAASARADSLEFLAAP